MRILLPAAAVLDQVLSSLCEVDVLRKRMDIDSTHTLAVRTVTVNCGPPLFTFRLLNVERWRECYCVLDGAAMAMEFVGGRYAVGF